ncbi:MAG TPA: ABC transporter ATP-binding protein [Burkholderiaceae bacterium]|nr:ABC transporter ATP-binding protein [Burkholderiaceae bacterium]
MPATAAPLITARDVGKVFRSKRGADVVALDGIDFDITSGEFISILGPSGCGKSTLLRCIGGLEEVTSGRLSLEGKEISEPPTDAGVVFQQDLLLDWRSVLDNVLLPAEFRGYRPGDWVDRARSLLATLGLAEAEARYPWELSGGMRQRVAICRGLLLDPKLLLMDEPFGALDAITRDELNMELERIWEKTSKTVLLITHSIAEAAFLSDRVFVMGKNPGRIIEVVDIDLPRPRTLDIRETAAFTAYQRRLRSIFESLGIMRGAAR